MGLALASAGPNLGTQRATAALRRVASRPADASPAAQGRPRCVARAAHRPGGRYRPLNWHGDGIPEQAALPRPRTVALHLITTTDASETSDLARSKLKGHEREEEAMPLYLSRFSYTPETWARLITNPEDRRTAAQSYIESVGGKLHGFWYAFGSHDGYTLWEAPDNVSMAAVALAIGSGGALSSLETTVLLTVDETLDALRQAEQVQYRAPGA